MASLASVNDSQSSSTLVPPSPTVQPADGRLGVLTVGLGAVASTLIAGVELVKRGLADPVGSLALMDTIRLGKRTENRTPKIKDFVPLAALEDVVFGAWDPFPDDAYVAAQRRGARGRPPRRADLRRLRDVRPMPAAFDRSYVKKLDADNVKASIDKRSMLNAIREDINRFREDKQVDRVVMIWAASTEIFIEPGPAHMSSRRSRRRSTPTTRRAPSMLYAYAALLEGVPFANGAPNLTVDIPALRQFAEERNIPISGKDFKTGQTLVKTVLAPMLKARMLGLAGWYSTNILGNRDGGARRSRQLQDQGGVEARRARGHPQARLVPEALRRRPPQVRINYYPLPRQQGGAGTTSTCSAGSATRCS